MQEAARAKPVEVKRKKVQEKVVVSFDLEDDGGEEDHSEPKGNRKTEAAPSSSSPFGDGDVDSEASANKKKKMLKDPLVDTSFLPDREREERERRERERLQEEWQAMQSKAKVHA